MPDALPAAARRMSFPLSAKILVWFLANLLFLAIVAAVVGREQFRFGFDSLLGGPGGDRLQAMAKIVNDELEERSRSEWPAVLARFAGAYSVKLALFRNDGVRIAGEFPELPAEVAERIRGPRAGDRMRGLMRDGPPRGPGRPGGGPPEGSFEGPPGELPEPFPKFMLRTSEPALYWVGTRVPLRDFSMRPPIPMTLMLASDSLRGGGLLFDFTPWLLAGGGVIVLSMLFWLPLIRGITGALGQMTGAAEQIAEGRFQTTVPTARRDELGRLGGALNHMAARLQEFFTGQKRFLGDIAHELCSPLARMELALSILEQHAEEKQRAYVTDVREEVQQMSALVNELLSFSKAGVQAGAVALQPSPLAELARRVIAREAPEQAGLFVEIDDSLAALAEPELLGRALANVVRNAIRYAGNAGPIVIAARPEGERVALTVSDQGPGVPEAALHRLFDPFFRPEAARTREAGGTGLGLAIVKTCVEACGGTVSVRNRPPSGLEVALLLNRASVAK